MGSILHGALMEIVGTDTAAELHEITLRPYSQCVYFDKEICMPIWRITTLHDEAYERIVQPLRDCDGNIFLKQKNYTVCLDKAVRFSECSYEKLANSVFQPEQAPRGVDVTFLTTTSFKHDGKYVIFPDVVLLFHSLISKWNAFSPRIVLSQEKLEYALAESCSMTKYDLHSLPYSLEGRNLYGFGGSMRLTFRGNDMTKRLMGLLWSFAPFAGMGIKTALGMGALKTMIRM
jgi:CRISPR-associated endoribonuclease Cas6